MTLNEVSGNQEVFNQVEKAIQAERRSELLRRLGERTVGLRLWIFGAAWHAHTVAEIPVSRIEEFVERYA